MSDVIGAQVRGELRDRYERVKENSPEELAESELIRELLDEGLRARELPLYNRLGVEDREGEPNPVGAQLEAAREPTESQEDVVRRFLAEAVEARQADVLDELEVDDELRDRVEAAREDGEILDDAVRRLLRRGVKAAADDGPAPLLARFAASVGVLILVGLPVGFALSGEGGTAGGFLLMYMVLVIFSPQINRAEAAVGGAIQSARRRLLG